MGAIGKLYGLDVHSSPYCGTTTTEFTRKQTRKFTNTRWVKKYLKKYSYKKFHPGVVQMHDKIIMHPLMYEKMLNEIKKEPKPRSLFGDCYA